MNKKISDKLIIGNALISTRKSQMTKKQVHQYWKIVDILLPEGYHIDGDNNSFENFCEEYNFLVKRFDDTLIIDCDITQLERCFRLGVSVEIINVFDSAGRKLNEIENQAIHEISYDQENIDNLRKHILEDGIVDKDGKVWRMIETSGGPCDVKITKESRKIAAKILTSLK